MNDEVDGMNENLANEIRKTIESIKDLKIQVGGLNNYLGILEGMARADHKKQVDEAYQRGYDKGYADKTNNDKVCKDIKKCKDDVAEIKQSVEDGVIEQKAGKKAIRKVAIFGDGSMQRIFRNYSASEAIAKLKAYEEKQKADEEIKVGDEVIDTQTGARFCVTHFWESNHGDKGVSGFNRECSAFQVTIGKAKKTGRHFDIDKILEEMRT